MAATSPPYRDPLRKQALACGLLAAAGVALAAFTQPADRTPAYMKAPSAITLALSFKDLDDGTVVAVDAADGEELARIKPGEGGFVRVTLRGMAKERKLQGLTDAEPFLLTELESGKLVLSDPLTGRRMLLDAFGASNAGSFAALLAASKGEG